jgi:hypothetical protein
MGAGTVVSRGGGEAALSVWGMLLDGPRYASYLARDLILRSDFHLSLGDFDSQP